MSRFVILYQDVPYFLTEIWTDVGWRGLALRLAFEIEAQTIAGDATGAGLQRRMAASNNGTG
jgi:hypothetical protein